MFEAGPQLVNRTVRLPVMLGHFLINLGVRLGRRLEATVVRLAIPGVCGLCGGAGQWDRCRAGLDLCVHCEAALPVAFGSGSSSGSGAGPGLSTPPVGATRIVAAFHYRPPVDFMIRQLKFGGDRSFARTLGLLLAEARLASEGPMPELIVPVPLHCDRLRERGYNQALELAHFAGRRLGVRVRAQALLRTRATKAQSGLAAAERSGNVQGCFSADARETVQVGGKRIALVDDVLTTGSTALEAARCLKGAGAAEIEIWVACRVGADLNDTHIGH